MKYEIKGGQLPVLKLTLNKDEAIICEAGAMSFMSPNIEMSTFGQGFKKSIGRIFMGETLFLNKYTAKNAGESIYLSSRFPGSIVPIEIFANKPFIAQKKSFLCASEDVELSIHFKRKLKTGLFGGEGFIMQKLSGSGIAFLEIDGHIIEKDLEANEQLIVSTGFLAGMEHTVTMEVETVKGAKNIFFGGEGLFHTVLTGPGRVYLQSMPFPYRSY